MDARSQQFRENPVQAEVQRLESEFLAMNRGPDHWVDETIDRWKKLLEGEAGKKKRKKYRAWLFAHQKTIQNSDEASRPITDAVRAWVVEQFKQAGQPVPGQFREGRTVTRELANSWILSQVDDRLAGRDHVMRSILALSLQYVVWNYQPGSREFECAYIGSNTLPQVAIRELVKTFRVPDKLGFVNWATAQSVREYRNDLEKKRRPESQGMQAREAFDWAGLLPNLVVLPDATTDMRGEVAAEDSVLGDLSVVGGPLFSPTARGLLAESDDTVPDPSGFFFLSFPFPGLFSFERQRTEVSNEEPRVVASLRKALGILEPYLTKSISNKRWGDFGADLERYEWRRESVDALVPLHDSAPSGYLASVLILLDSGSHSMECRVNEKAVREIVQGRLTLSSFSPDRWDNPLRHHLEEFARLLEGAAQREEPDRTPQTAGALAWVPQIVEQDKRPLRRVIEPLYPEKRRKSLDEVTLSSWNAEVDWTEWHVARLEEWRPKNDSPISRAAQECMGLYAGSHTSLYDTFVDLVVPIVINRQVVGFFRFNCVYREGEHVMNPGQSSPFRNLYELVRIHIRRMSGLLGRLLQALESVKLETAGFQGGASDLDIPKLRRAVSARRIIFDWVVEKMVESLKLRGSATEELRKMKKEQWTLDVAASALRHVNESRIMPGKVDLKKVAQVVREFCLALREEKDLPEIALISLWARDHHPVLTMPEPGDSEELEHLFLADPGLVQVLRYLYVSKALSAGAFDFDGQGLDLLTPRYVYGHDEERSDTPFHPIEDTNEVVCLGGSVCQELKYLRVDREGKDRHRTDRMRVLWKGKDGVHKEAVIQWDFQTHPHPLILKHVPGRVSPVISKALQSPVSQAAITPELLDAHIDDQQQSRLVDVFDEIDYDTGQIGNLEATMVGPGCDSIRGAEWDVLKDSENTIYLYSLGRNPTNGSGVCQFRKFYRSYALNQVRGIKAIRAVERRAAWVNANARKRLYAHDLLAEFVSEFGTPTQLTSAKNALVHLKHTAVSMPEDEVISRLGSILEDLNLGIRQVSKDAEESSRLRRFVQDDALTPDESEDTRCSLRRVLERLDRMPAVTVHIDSLSEKRDDLKGAEMAYYLALRNFVRDSLRKGADRIHVEFKSSDDVNSSRPVLVIRRKAGEQKAGPPSRRGGMGLLDDDEVVRDLLEAVGLKVLGAEVDDWRAREEIRFSLIHYIETG